MRLTAIEIRGFRAFAGRERLDVDADAVIVSGANGRGKTSVFDAILWGIGGMVPRLRGDSRNIVSLYSESGEASVALEFKRDDGSLYRIRRSQQGGSEDQQLQVETRNDIVLGPAAGLKLLEDLWPNALMASSRKEALANMVGRGIYLQQDLVRQFVDADSDDDRFEVISELIGAGRVYELQKQLETARKAWSTVTNNRTREEEVLRARLGNLETELASLAAGVAAGAGDAQSMWRSWWGEASASGITARYPDDPGAAEANQALDMAVKQAQMLRRSAERRLDIANSLLREFRERDEQARPNIEREELVRRLEAARQKTRTAREALQTAEATAAQRRHILVQRREEAEELRALAQIAQRHLKERCPVCKQPFDRNVVRQHLETLLRPASGASADIGEADGVTEAAELLARCETEEASAAAAVRAIDHAGDEREASLHDRNRRVADLGVADDVSDPREAVERVRQQVLAVVERLKASETAGERLGLMLAQAGEQARRVEIQRQVDELRQQVAMMQQAIVLRNRTSHLTDNIIEALRDTATEVVRAKLEAIDPIVRKIYSSIDPHPAFRDTKLSTWLSYGRGRLALQVYDSVRDVSAGPLRVLSSSQMNALAVTLFLSFNVAMASLPLEIAILDDPLQSLDDVNLLGLSDLLRRIKTRRQLLVSTHDARFSQLLQRKLRPGEIGQRTRIIELEGWSRSGPTVDQADVPAETRAVRIAAAVG